MLAVKAPPPQNFQSADPGFFRGARANDAAALRQSSGQVEQLRLRTYFSTRYYRLALLGLPNLLRRGCLLTRTAATTRSR